MDGATERMETEPLKDACVPFLNTTTAAKERYSVVYPGQSVLLTAIRFVVTEAAKALLTHMDTPSAVVGVTGSLTRLCCFLDCLGGPTASAHLGMYSGL